DALNARGNLAERLQPLSTHRRLERDEAGNIAARVRQTSHEAATHRVRAADENDRYGPGRLLQGGDHWRALRKQHVGARIHQISRIVAQAIQLTGCKTNVNSQIVRLAPPRRLQLLPERGDPRPRILIASALIQ